MRKSRLAWLALALLIVLCLCWLGWVKSARGFSATAKPTWIESKLAGLSRHMALPGADKKLVNPVPPTSDNLAHGRAHFAAHCALCHDNNGDGHTDIGDQLYPKPPDLRGATQRRSDGDLFYSIRNGIRLSGMPAWPDDSDQETWQLVDFIRSLPRLTPQELETMKAYNPKTIYPEPIM